jgi:hypothetical protein
MDPQMIGALAGGVLGLVNLALLWSVAAGMEKGSPRGARTARIIKGVAILDIFIFAGLGYYVGPMVAG